MRMSLCCCGTFDECSGCRVPNRFDLSNIGVDFDDVFAWDPVNATCSLTGYEIIQYASDASNIASGIQLRKRTSTSQTGYGYSVGTSLCQWLWNDVIAVQSLYHWRTTGGTPSTYYEGQTIELAQYTPLNATDSTSPWNRVTTLITDTTCGTCVWSGCTNLEDKWRCITGLYSNYSRLELVEVSAGVYWWLLTVQSYSERSVSGAFTLNGAHPIGSGYSGAKGGTCGNYSGTGALPVAQRRYNKVVDCSSDFDGEPIVLSFLDSPSGSVGYTSYPTTASLILNEF